MYLLFLTATLFLSSPGSKVTAQPGGKKTCTIPEGKEVPSGEQWQEGCLVYTCNNGKVEEKLAEKCSKLIEEQVSNIIEKKLEKCDVPKMEKEALEKVVIPAKYQNPGFIVAGGSWQTQVKLFKPDTKEVCDLPKLPEYFSHSSMDLVNGTPVMCGSWFGSPGKSRKKNETENRSFFAVSSCVQLSPASKEAEWTIYAEDLPLKRDHVSMSTSEGIYLMGGYNSKDVTLVKPDGSQQRDVFSLNRFIDRGCGIEDDDTLIITGGGSRGQDAIATKTVDRYNKKGFVEDLPDMMTARTSHGCGFFYQQGKKVLVVAGGYAGKYDEISSTEMLIMGTNAWTSAAPLPTGIWGFASTSLNNKIYFIVGDEDSKKASVLEFDGENWTETQKERYNRMNSNARGNKAIAIDLGFNVEKIGFDEFCN